MPWTMTKWLWIWTTIRMVTCIWIENVFTCSPTNMIRFSRGVPQWLIVMSGGRTNGKIKRRFCSYGFIYYRGWSSFDRRDSTPRREERSLAGDLCDVAYFRTGTYQKHTRHLGCEQPNPFVGRCRCESHAECSGRLYVSG